MLTLTTMIISAEVDEAMVWTNDLETKADCYRVMAMDFIDAQSLVADGTIESYTVAHWIAVHNDENNVERGTE